MKTPGVIVFAFCMLVISSAVGIADAEAQSSYREHLARFTQRQLNLGARDLPTLAQLSYRDALAALEDGKPEVAEQKLRAAIEFDPNYADAYFTLSRLTLRKLEFDAAVYLMQAITVSVTDFGTQSQMALNGLIIAIYVLFLVALVLCVAFSLRYLPFVAHKIKEPLRDKLNAVAPSFSAYMILLLPLVVMPGIITSLAYLTVLCWVFMRRRERLVVLGLAAPFIVFGLLDAHLRPFTSIADPKSLTSLVAEANHGAATGELLTAIREAPAEGLDFEKSIALGLLHQRRGELVSAADRFFHAVSERPERAIGYVNLGNVYFLQGQYEKAIEGYRKAEGLEPENAICQHALAQAYIKTLLMKESSQALQAASTLGIEKIKSSYTPGALARVRVFPMTFSSRDLWRMAAIEGHSAKEDYLDEILSPFMRFPRKTSAWILIAALTFAAIVGGVVKPWRLTFQCANCGDLTCQNCCNDDREMVLCQRCAKTIENVTSEKVIDALLRQKRQATLVKRRKATRFVTMILPGVRDITYGRLGRGLALAGLFAISLVHVFSRGYVTPSSTSLVVPHPMWTMILPVAGIVLAYGWSIRAKQGHDYRVKRYDGRRSRDTRADGFGSARAA